MRTRKRIKIEGNVQNVEHDDFHAHNLAVRAYVEGKEVACAKVDKHNHYQLTFEGGDEPPVTELRVLPFELTHNGHDMLALNKIVSPQRYKLMRQENTIYASYDLHIPHEFLGLMGWIIKRYRMHGAVYATTFAGGLPISIEPLPAAKIEFYEVDILRGGSGGIIPRPTYTLDTPPFHIPSEPSHWPPGWEPPDGPLPPLPTEAYLGYAYSAPDGSYTFNFNFSYRQGVAWLLKDTVPDIQARISQFVGGAWTKIYEGPVDWNIIDDFHRDYFIPIEDIFPVPDGWGKPEEGFRYLSLGLLPIDETRIVKGYASAKPEDPARIVGISRQPFCGTLRLFGLFAETPPVTSYKVEMATADEDGPVGAWLDVVDPLVNQKWHDTTHVWEPVTLGPDPVTHRYVNIDTEAEANWHEPTLKFTWNSANWPNGYYALRITSFDASNTIIGTYQMPVVRVDNTVPEVKLTIEGTSVGAVGICGALKLGLDRLIHLKVTAFDPEGHVWKYSLSSTRGKDVLTAGPAIEDDRNSHVPGGLWTGVNDYPVSFSVFTLPPALAGCSTLAYNISLQVWGLATDAYDVHPLSQWRYKESNLVVSEP